MECPVVGRLNALCRETGEYGVPTQNRMLKNRQSRLEFDKRFSHFHNLPDVNTHQFVVGSYSLKLER